MKFTLKEYLKPYKGLSMERKSVEFEFNTAVDGNKCSHQCELSHLVIEFY